jgi:hypothetical protein
MDRFILHMPLADNVQPHEMWMIAAGVMLLAIWVLMRPRKTKDPLEQSVPRMSMAQQKNVERQMESLLVEFAEMARQISAQLDTRSAKLELLIKDADEKLAALGARLAAPDGAQGKVETLTETKAAAPAKTPAKAPVKSSAKNSAKTSTKAQGPPPPQHADVYQLADQGRSPLEIAKQLNRPSGEVELILALRPKT